MGMGIRTGMGIGLGVGHTESSLKNRETELTSFIGLTMGPCLSERAREGEGIAVQVPFHCGIGRRTGDGVYNLCPGSSF